MNFSVNLTSGVSLRLRHHVVRHDALKRCDFHVSVFARQLLCCSASYVTRKISQLLIPLYSAGSGAPHNGALCSLCCQKEIASDHNRPFSRLSGIRMSAGYT